MIPHFIITYDPVLGYCMADGKVEDFYQIMIESLSKQDNASYLVLGNMLAITRFRLGVKNGECTLSVWYDNIERKVDSTGQLDNWANMPFYESDYIAKINRK